MRVLIDMSYADRGPSGTATYLEGVTSALAELPDVDVVEARRKPRRAGRSAGGGAAGSALNLAADLAWLHLRLPEIARRTGADVLHHPLPANSTGFAGAQVITVQDLAFERLPDHFDAWWRTLARHRHLRAARRSSAVICISASTARDVSSRWGIDERRIVVAPLAAGGSDGGPLPEVSSDYLLYVGDAEPRKNLAGLMSAWRLYGEEEHRAGREPLRLVLAGTLRAGREQEPPASSEGLQIVRDPSAAELDSLLKGATALVHPSLHEGFGLTMIEAMARGCPVLAPLAAGAVEVCGDAALYFDPRDPATLAVRLGEIAGDRDLLRQLAKAGQRRAAELTWAETARRHREAYLIALGSSER